MGTRAWTPNPHRATSLEDNGVQSRRSKSVGRYVGVEAELQQQQQHSHVNGRMHLSSETGTDLGGTQFGPSLMQRYSTNRFALERSRTRHFHLPPYRFEKQRCRMEPALLPPPMLPFPETARCLHCGLPCYSLSGSEVEYIFKTFGEKDIHKQWFAEQLDELIKATAIGQRLDQSATYLQSLIDCLKACTTNTKSSRPLLAYTSSDKCHCRLQQLTNVTSPFFPSTVCAGPYLHQIHVVFVLTT
ncbi:unnamed protein product [Gongylonema pulchrum]|uniref:Uncharacterized protein n=1 Tax=Gongylonema pulchrum TaxID=637853 RepID=A0A183ENU1_9BILA|nr:unnamed protein product [Gongylonema pulchrum]